jgi:endonuclease YncB( thermonuclease family)
MRTLTVLLTLMIACPASAQTVTDGDTLKLGEKRVRLWSIDAPEIH